MSANFAMAHLLDMPDLTAFQAKYGLQQDLIIAVEFPDIPDRAFPWTAESCMKFTPGSTSKLATACVAGPIKPKSRTQTEEARAMLISD